MSFEIIIGIGVDRLASLQAEGVDHRAAGARGVHEPAVRGGHEIVALQGRQIEGDHLAGVEIDRFVEEENDVARAGAPVDGLRIVVPADKRGDVLNGDAPQLLVGPLAPGRAIVVGGRAGDDDVLGHYRLLVGRPGPRRGVAHNQVDDGRAVNETDNCVTPNHPMKKLFVVLSTSCSSQINVIIWEM